MVLICLRRLSHFDDSRTAFGNFRTARESFETSVSPTTFINVNISSNKCPPTPRYRYSYVVFHGGRSFKYKNSRNYGFLWILWIESRSSVLNFVCFSLYAYGVPVNFTQSRFLFFFFFFYRDRSRKASLIFHWRLFLFLFFFWRRGIFHLSGCMQISNAFAILLVQSFRLAS